MEFTKFINVRKDLRDGNPDDYFTICKRDNNPKREFIIVQNYLGKHVPERPKFILNYFEKLKDEINNKTDYEFNQKRGPNSEGCLSKGLNGIFYFAETATAIGEYLNDNLRISYKFYTSREKKNKEILATINEDHCHAPLHTIYGSSEELKKCERILIVDDEITSGNTIEKVIAELRKINSELKIYIASFINLMTPERTMEFILDDIKIVSLLSGDIGKDQGVKMSEEYNDYETDYYKDSILVLGTEEDMYNALMYARKLEEQKFNVYFHASTRSPIVPSNQDNYSLKTRTNFVSAKDPGRKIYLYNLQKYKQIFIFRDKENQEFDKITNEILSKYSELPIKFYDYNKGGEINEQTTNM